ncbi:Hypothetical protein A7982_10890 [Minicystis rosea]|nr:Hypothetical protein A7982_10890 [Minicystis rosea]
MANPTRSNAQLLPLPIVALALVSAFGGCAEPPVFLPPGQAGSPAGVLSGTVTYSGPLPCTRDGRIVGAAVLEVFDTRFLPPPEGLGTTAQSLAVVPGSQLFAGVAGRLTFNENGELWCPDETAKHVNVSASWTAAPLVGALYEVRGFYDYDENFDPVISIFKFPTKGDIAGGAIENAAEVLQGAAPAYRRIGLGIEQPDGTFQIPEEGSNIGGITVTLGLPLPLQPPIFNAKSVNYSSKACKNKTIVDAPSMSADPRKVTMPSDYTLPVFAPTDPAGTQDSLVRITVGAGVDKTEIDQAAVSPFNLPVKSPAPTFAFNWQDVNNDGTLALIDDHVPDSSIIPSLFPLSIFSKLDDELGPLVPQASPAIILQGLTMYKDLPQTAFFAPGTTAIDASVTVGVRPAVLCLDPNDFTKHAKLVVTHKTDCTGNVVITDELGTKAALKRQFGREVDIVEGCLPQGSYALNLIYSTGQAWTVPNEAGVCQALEASQDGGKTCGDPTTEAHRPVLPSQAVVLTIGKPDEPSWCDAHPTPEECFPVKTE